MRPLLALAGITAALTLASSCAEAAPRTWHETRVVVVHRSPPPVRHVRHAAVRPGFVWAAGYWRWNGRRHDWVDGRWLPARRGYVYVGSRWQPVRHGWRFVPGHWVRR